MTSGSEEQTPRFYAKPGLNAETYDVRVANDWANEGEPGDVQFIMNLAQNTGGPVLELASGTGRVLWPLADTGFECVGLDLNPSMLTMAQAKRDQYDKSVCSRIRFVEASMTSFELEQQFALIYCTFRSFQMLLEPELQRQCLQCAHRHLKPGGTLMLNLFDPRLHLVVADTTEWKRPRSQVNHPVSGNPVALDIVDREADPFSQTFVETWRFTEYGDDGSGIRCEDECLRMRWTYRHEMRYLLELCGFDIESEHSDFNGGPPTYGREQVWVARRV